MQFLHDPVFTLLGIYPREMKTNVHMKQPMCKSINEKPKTGNNTDVL